MENSKIYYEPAEDSYLLLKWALKKAKGRVIEIGSGSGIVIEKLIGKEGIKEIYATDIDKEVIEHLKRKFGTKIKIIHSDLFQQIPKIKFDTILFNPPYLPEEGWEDYKTKIQTVGGKEGNEIIIRFLNEAIEYLSEKGEILLIVSSLSSPKRIFKEIKRLELNYKILECLRFDFEEVCVISITR